MIKLHAMQIHNPQSFSITLKFVVDVLTQQVAMSRWYHLASYS